MPSRAVPPPLLPALAARHGSERPPPPVRWRYRLYNHVFKKKGKKIKKKEPPHCPKRGHPAVRCRLLLGSPGQGGGRDPRCRCCSRGSSRTGWDWGGSSGRSRDGGARAEPCARPRPSPASLCLSQKPLGQPARRAWALGFGVSLSSVRAPAFYFILLVYFIIYLGRSGRSSEEKK